MRAAKYLIVTKSGSTSRYALDVMTATVEAKKMRDEFKETVIVKSRQYDEDKEMDVYVSISSYPVEER